VDGQRRYDGTHEPAGLWSDGPSSAYQTFVLPAGEHTIAVRLSDDGQAGRYRYQASQTVTLVPGQHFVVEFDATAGGFQFAGRRVAQLTEEPSS
jgi:hypothetical protein